MLGLNPISSAAISALDGQGRSASVVESATASEAEFVAASVFFAALSEALQAIDAASASAAFPTFVSESTTVSDSASSAATFPSAINEAGAISDATSAAAAFASLVAELTIAQDSVSVAASIFGASINETAFGLDNYDPAGSTYNAPVQVSVTIFDDVVGAYLWNPIPDDQDPNWGPVNTAQTTAWGVIDTAEASDWQVIENYLGTGAGGDSSYAGAAFGEVPFSGGGSGTGAGWVEIQTDTPTAWTVIGSIL